MDLTFLMQPLDLRLKVNEKAFRVPRTLVFLGGLRSERLRPVPEGRRRTLVGFRVLVRRLYHRAQDRLDGGPADLHGDLPQTTALNRPRR